MTAKEIITLENERQRLELAPLMGGGVTALGPASERQGEGFRR